jgi:hypothetical protein
MNNILHRFSISFSKAADSNFFIHKTPHTYNIPFLQSDTTRETKKAAGFLQPPRFGWLPFRETEKPPLFVPVFRDVFHNLCDG